MAVAADRSCAGGVADEANVLGLADLADPSGVAELADPSSLADVGAFVGADTPAWRRGCRCWTSDVRPWRESERARSTNAPVEDSRLRTKPGRPGPIARLQAAAVAETPGATVILLRDVRSKRRVRRASSRERSVALASVALDRADGAGLVTRLGCGMDCATADRYGGGGSRSPGVLLGRARVGVRLCCWAPDREFAAAERPGFPASCVNRAREIRLCALG